MCKTAQHVGQKTVQCCIDTAQAQHTGIFFRNHVIAQFVQAHQEALPLFIQALARSIGAHIAPLAHQQGAAHLPFQNPHLLGNGCGAEVQLPGRFRHGAAVHYFQKIVDV